MKYKRRKKNDEGWIRGGRKGRFEERKMMTDVVKKNGRE
jgi:hypothetical protein